MTAGGGIIARLVPGNPVIKVSGVSRYPLLMLRVIPRWLPSFLWIHAPPYLVILAPVQAFYANHLFDSSIRRGQTLL